MAESERIRSWLASTQTQTFLGKLARSLSRNMRRENIRPPFLGNGHPADAEAVIPDLVSELAVFILQDKSRIQALILAGDPNLARYLHHAFLNHCRDLVRRADVDPVRYYRKRAGEVLRQSAPIHTALRGERYVMFSLHAENASEAAALDVDLGSIPLPPKLAEGLDYETACRKEVLEQLAVYFWQSLTEARGGRQAWVDLRDFVNWVGCYVPMTFTTAAQDDAEQPAAPVSDRPGTRGPEPSLSDLQPLPRPGSEQIKKLAACFTAQLDSKDRAVFYHRCFEEASWDEVARRTAFSGPSGPHYRYDQIVGRLRAFLREWPGLSPEDEDPETMDRFMDKLRAILKKSLSVS